MNIISIEYMIDIRLQPTECNLDIGCTYCMFIYVYVYIYIYMYLYTRISVATLSNSSLIRFKKFKFVKLTLNFLFINFMTLGLLL